MGKADFYQSGDWNATCSMCGGKFKASQLVRHWQGLYRCSKCWEPRQPQDFVRATSDVQTVPWSQPQTDIDIEICTINGMTAIPGAAIPGCSIPGRLVPIDLSSPPFETIV